ncbi:hypothetical protein PF003_g33739 [Phytophthora fragariae]|nr:hypothetical protein PF003_g33739 [Phytophthora fragariae]
MSIKLDNANEFSRTAVVAAVNLEPGEKRGYWKTHTPEKTFRQAKVIGKVDDHRAVLMFDSGAEMSLMGIAFARKVGCRIDEERTKSCVGVGDAPYETLGRTTIKITLAGNLVYKYHVWVGDLPGQDVLLGMEFMVPAGVRVDAGDGSICLPDEVRIRMLGRRQLFSAKRRPVFPRTPQQIKPGQSYDFVISPDLGVKQQFWVCRGKGWIPTVLGDERNQPRRLRVTNVGNHLVRIDKINPLGIWMSDDLVPREYGFVTTRSNRYAEWQNLVFGSTREYEEVAEVEEDHSPLVDHPEYPTPRAILKREPEATAEKAPQQEEAEEPPHPSVIATVKAEGTTSEGSANDSPVVEDMPTPGADEAPLKDILTPRLSSEPLVAPPELTLESNADDAICYHEGSDLFAEDVEQEMAVLPVVSVSLTQEVRIEDLKVGMPDNVPREVGIREQERLRRIIWKKKTSNDRQRKRVASSSCRSGVRH